MKSMLEESNEGARFIVYAPRQVPMRDFVNYWAAKYQYKNEHLYTKNIGLPLMPTRVRELYEWKNGSRLSDKKQHSVEINFIARLNEIEKLPRDTSPMEFLNRFANGGAIWRIFWLHCWDPDRFPIYDQHVHRAMALIQQQASEEISAKDADKVQSYLGRYLPFHGLFEGINGRQVDKALWFYGKLHKSTNLESFL